jgi:hypothetical protein
MMEDHFPHALTQFYSFSILRLPLTSSHAVPGSGRECRDLGTGALTTLGASLAQVPASFFRTIYPACHLKHILQAMVSAGEC